MFALWSYFAVFATVMVTIQGRQKIGVSVNFHMKCTLVVLLFFVTFSVADKLELGTTVVTYGKDVRFDCNISQSEEEAVWGRTTSKGNQLLYAGLFPIRAKDANNIKISSVNYSLFLDSVTLDDEGSYVCTQSPRTLASYRLKVIVKSEIRIQHERKNLSGRYFDDKGNGFQLDCVVFRARENPMIEWKEENITLTEDTGETINSSNKYMDGTFDFRKTLTYVIKHDTELLCSSYAVFNESVSILISTVPFHNPAHSSKYTALVIIFLLAFLIAVLVGGWVYLKRYQGSPLSILIRVSNNETMSPPSGLMKIDNNAQVTPTGKESQSKLSRRLPDVPKQRPSYARNITEEAYYAAVSYNLPTSKVFLRKRICLISRISDGIICERWVGNVTTTDGKKNCALISRLKGIIHFEQFSWDKLVKRLLELPENPHIFKVKGMCFDEPHLFLLQEYMTCESLVEYLSVTTYGTERGQEDMDMFGLKLTNISLQVSYGMEFAMTYGLSHPALSMKKIIINEGGICKLYDFCLTEDASKFVECLKSEPEFLASSHPQECVARNEYTCASDVWYTAFSIREIYSYGSNQFPRNSSLTNEISETYSLQPKLCSSIVYEQIKECMTSNQNDRPKTVKALLSVLKEVGSTPMSNSSADAEKHRCKYSSYVPMIEGNREEMYSLPVKFKNVIA